MPGVTYLFSEKYMTYSMLNPEERASLQNFVDRSVPGTPYLRRAKILLLADDKATQETIAAEVAVPITRVRQMLRAFDRERIALFPEKLFSPNILSADDDIAEAGRQIMASLSHRAMSHTADLETKTSVTAVHETRKTIRRLRTAFQIFEPYYENGVSSNYRRRFRKFMRRLGRSRDAAVFLMNLERYATEGFDSDFLTPEEMTSLSQMKEYWGAKKAKADEKVRRYLAKDKYQELIQDFEPFTQTRGAGVKVLEDPFAPTKLKHVAPVLISEKVATVQAYGPHLNKASLKLLHQLRIQFKELRYTLEFFRPVMGPLINSAIETVKKLQTHLGDLNDAVVHLEMLSNIEDELLFVATEHYRQVKEADLSSLIDELPDLWNEFDCQEWRQQLAMSVAAM